MKRNIRLKERRLNDCRVHTPALEYRKKRPFLSSESYFEVTDRNGVIRNELGIESLDKILFLGGSFLESIYTSSIYRLTSLLEKKLNQDGYNYQIINGGVSGATSLNLFNTLLNKYIQWGLKKVFFFVPTNDGVCLNLKNNLWNMQKNYSNLVNIHSKDELDDQYIDMKLKEFKNLYLLLFKTCKLFEIELHICLSPMVSNITDFYLDNEERNASLYRNRSRVFDCIKDLCKKKNIPCIDFRDKFNDRREFFFDDVHLNRYGSAEISKYFYEYLLHIDISSAKNKDYIFCQKELFMKCPLKEEVFWLDDIFIDKNSEYECVLSLSLDCGHNVENNNALFCVNFYGNANVTENTGLYLSKHVGHFKYLFTIKEAYYDVHYSFLVPKGIGKFKIGLKLWRNFISDIKANNIKLFIRKKLI